jgi:hypothetical protein
MSRLTQNPLTRASLAVGAVALMLVGCSRPETAQSETAQSETAQAETAPSETAQADSATAELHPEVGTASDVATGTRTCLVTDSAIGPIRLGMTLAEVRQALPSATLERSEDGDGAAWISVLVGGENLMSFAAEDDGAGEIDLTKSIRLMETFSPSCRTIDGVHPGSLVLDAERVMGKTAKIVKSEIESREYIEFERHPAGMTFRLDYTGIFQPGSRETRRFDPAGKIFSIAISSF